MKKTPYHFMIVYVTVLVNCAFAQLGIPSYFWMGTYTINDYPGSGNDLDYRHKEGTSFRNSLYARITIKYPSVYCLKHIDLRDEDVIASNWLNQSVDIDDAVLFAGHGTNGAICTYDWNVAHSGTTSWGYGTNYTKWVFLDACLTLNGEMGDFFD